MTCHIVLIFWEETIQWAVLFDSCYLEDVFYKVCSRKPHSTLIQTKSDICSSVYCNYQAIKRLTWYKGLWFQNNLSHILIECLHCTYQLICITQLINQCWNSWRSFISDLILNFFSIYSSEAHIEICFYIIYLQLGIGCKRYVITKVI